jgi:serine/threonine protein kinase
MGQPKPDQVFISYAHEDVAWRDEFEGMLAPACTRGLIELWSDKSIAAGESWGRDIDQALVQARVGLLLVSDHFLKSEFINNVELARLLASAQKGGIAIRWVPISASLYDVSPLNDIQACWDPARPLDGLPIADRKTAIKKICLEIVEEFGSSPKLTGGRRESLRSQVQAKLGDRYQIEEEVATGKFAIFYRARRRNPERIVGVKVFVASELDDWARRAFVESVERAVELESPAFIDILEHFLDEPPECLVTEFIDGEQLSKFLARHPTGAPLGTVKGILLDLARAIEEQHQRGWQRGEICPSDVLIEKAGAARLSPVDFSNIRREQAQLSGNFLVDRESMAYMSPERFFGQQRTELTDQYSLGLIATELLGGARLPRVVSPCDLERKRTVFAELESGNGEWARRSPEFAGVVARMLRVDPEARWPSMSDVRQYLREIHVPETPAEASRKRTRAVYLRVQAGGVEGEREFYRKFYENLFALCPDVEPHFRHVDMARQYQILNRAIHLMLSFRPESGDERDQLRQVASRHARLGLTRRHYDLFLEALVKTLGECQGGEAACLEAWRETVAPALEFMWQCQVENGPAAPAGVEEPAAGPPKVGTPTPLGKAPRRRPAARPPAGH